jgi:hypothetical protein
MSEWGGAASLFGEIQHKKGSYIVNASIRLSKWVSLGQGGSQVQTNHERGRSGGNIRTGVFLPKIYILYILYFTFISDGLAFAFAVTVSNRTAAVFVAVSRTATFLASDYY